MGELYSLLRFLRAYPFAHYFCRKGVKRAAGLNPDPCSLPCACCALDVAPRGRSCPRSCCTHAGTLHSSWWNRYVANPIIKAGARPSPAAARDARAAVELLRGTVLEATLLRRTKDQCADALALPPRTVRLRRDAFDERESDFFEALYTQQRAEFGAYVAAGTLLNNYAHVFDMLVRLRQVRWREGGWREREK